MIKELWPMCAVCKKLVEEVEIFDDFRNDTKVIIAKCHGTEDRCELTKEWIVFAKLHRGYAFMAQAITEREKEIRALLPSTDELNKLILNELARINKLPTNEEQ